ncbi:MAG: BMC domain-containing protein [Clostridia bacterium]|nr:BMC domain-containing protein [Clostridia bacterium]
MSKALAMVEYLTVATGITAADLMVKTADVELIEAHVVCPGKYIALIQGELSAVTAAVEAAKVQYPQKLVDSFVLGNPEDSIFPAIYGATEVTNPAALGIFETYSAASIIVAADIASKTADVQLIELRIAKGMCGKSYMLITGEVAAVQASIDTVKERLKESSMYLDSSVIANPDKETWQNII